MLTTRPISSSLRSWYALWTLGRDAASRGLPVQLIHTRRRPSCVVFKRYLPTGHPCKAVRVDFGWLQLKQQTEGEIVVYATRPLVHTLMEHDLVDELRLTRLPGCARCG
jgi:hypothetical protein